MLKLVLLRHGESTWNKENRFTGWTDVDLSKKGSEEAENSGVILKNEGYVFDIAYTSVLKRAIRTLWITLDKMDLMWIPVFRSWRLNERHYGALQGLNKSETAEKFGDKQVLIWRRSYDIPPPELQKTDERYPGNEDKYKDLDEKDLPLSECLKDTVERFLPYWHKEIAPSVKTLNKVDYCCLSPGETIEYMKKVEKPWIAFKVLGAGVTEPRRGFKDAFDWGADFINIGMYDFQVKEDVLITKKVLSGSLKRERTWCA